MGVNYVHIAILSGTAGDLYLFPHTEAGMQILITVLLWAHPAQTIPGFPQSGRKSKGHPEGWPVHIGGIYRRIFLRLILSRVITWIRQLRAIN
jgi:hypothetical protein